MKPTELDALVNSASSSTSNNSTSSNQRNLTAKRRNGFPPITREARTRTRRWLLFLIAVLMLLFLGWRFILRPYFFPLANRPPEDRSPILHYTSPPFDQNFETSTQKIDTETLSTLSLSTTTTQFLDVTTQNSKEERPDVMLRPPEITWRGDPPSPETDLQSKFKIEADFGDESKESDLYNLKDHSNPQVKAIITGHYSSTFRPQPSVTLNQAPTTQKYDDKDEDYEDENRILLPNRKPENTERKGGSGIRINPAAKAHPSVNIGSRLTSSSSTTTSTPSPLTTTSRKSDGSRIVHPRANSGAGGSWDQLTTQKSTTPSKSSDVDEDLKDLINQLEKNAPVWRIEPKDMPKVTPPPMPTENLKSSVAPISRPKVPAFSIHASVQTIPVQKGKDYELKQPTGIKDHRHKIDKRSNTPIIVTGLLNIGRGDWERFTRPYDLYLDYLMDLLKLDNRFIIYCDEEAEQFLAQQKDLDWDRLQLVRITLKDLPFYRHREEIAKIIDYEQKNWNKSWDNRFRDHPEALFPDYNILVNSKPWLMHNATQISRFESDFYVWIDAGYSHGSKTLIPSGLWDPELKNGKITVIKITSELDKPERYTLEMVYRKRWDVISGGVLAGDQSTIRRFSVLFFKTFMALLDQGKIDDDQTVLLMTIKNYASTFNILSGGWFDGFKLMPSRHFDG